MTPKKPKRKLSAYNKYIGREMRAGKTMKQAAASWKRKGSKKSSPKKKTGKSNPKGGTRTMAKNSFNMNKIYSLANKVAFVAPYASIAMSAHTPQHKVELGVYYLSGWRMWDSTWSFEGIKKGWTGYVATKIITALVPKITSFFKGLL